MATALGREKRKQRIRKKILGSSERPRLSVFRSNKHLYAQMIDDQAGRTLVSASTVEKGVFKGTRNKNIAQELGKRLGEKAKAANIEQAIFDRNGYIYHGCLKAFAEGAREAGLRF
ncbi:MAG: 50S ribosomal protein L18 [Deltaproteobacteria bacterium]|nr:50S ribosomal protein L18 [Deltaproteobacteria bacterium]